MQQKITFLVAARQPGDGTWLLRSSCSHSEGCAGQNKEGINVDKSGGTVYVSSVYTAKQVMWCVLPHLPEKGTLTACEIAAIVKTKEIFRQQPCARLFRAVQNELRRHMDGKRELQMAAMEGFIELLRKLGHRARLFTVGGKEMKDIRIKAA